MNTQIIDTLSTAPTDFDPPTDPQNKMVLYEYLDGLRFLYSANMREFVKTDDVDHYIKAQKFKKRIKAILNRE